jgi:hypothetical protein
MSRQPPRRRQKSPKYTLYAGPTTCLRCDQEFWSWDRRRNRLCLSCREAIDREPSEEPPAPFHHPTRRPRNRDDG